MSGCASCADWQRPRAYFCETPTYPGPDTEDPQCGPAWRCGLEKRCHAIGATAAYQCLSDADCEGGWRCGPEGRCLDVATEALRPTGLTGGLRATAVSPLASASPPSAVSSSSFTFDEGCGPLRADSISFVTDAGTVRSVQYPSGKPYGGCDAGTRVFSAFAAAPPMTSAPLAVVDTAAHTLVLGEGGHLCRFRASSGGAGLSSCDALALDFAATALRAGRSSALPVVARSDSRYALIAADGRASITHHVVPTLTGQQESLLDLLPFTADDGSAALIAVTSSGAFIAAVPGGPADAGVYLAPADDAWQPAGVPRTTWPGEAPPPDRLGALRSLAWVNGYSAVSGVVRTDDGTDLVVVFGEGGTPGGHPPAVLEGTALGTPSSCLACPSGALDSYSVSRQANALSLIAETRCRDPLTGAVKLYAATLGGPACTPVELGSAGPQVAVSGISSPGAAATAGRAGQVWLQTGFGLSRAARYLDRAPSLVLSGASGLLAGAEAVSTLLPSGPVELEERQLFGLSAGEGLVARSAQGAPPLLAAVEGQGAWALQDAVTSTSTETPPTAVEVTSGARNLLAVFTTTETFKPPYHAAAQASGEHTVLVVTAFDALLAAELDPGASVTLATAPVLRVKVVPLNRSEITAVTLLPHEEGTPYAEGYLLSAGRLHRFTASSLAVWKTQELELPEGEPFALFHDGRRGRAGFRDGRVFALPGRVELAPALPEGEGPASDFADVCGQVLAVGAHRAFRLVSGAAGVGTWQPVPLPEGPGGPVKLHATEGGAYVFFDDGRVVKLEGVVCL
ncbi:MAG: hypothetical protein IPJ65_11990 [Archangiaceae bacterium]|nr:hypothetical protein [Archangiaceae bacterium]